MRCPECDATENRVVDTRASRGGRAVRRRRECAVCGARFTTYEYVEERPIQVLKRSGAVEPFDRGKLLDSVRLEGGTAAPASAKTVKTVGGAASPAAASAPAAPSTAPAAVPAQKATQPPAKH